jgi:hypothetical protein
MLGKLALVFFTCFALVLGQNGGFLGLLGQQGGQQGGGFLGRAGGLLGGLGGNNGNNNANNNGDNGGNQDDNANNNNDNGDNGNDGGNQQQDDGQNTERATNILNSVSQGLEMGTNLAQRIGGQGGDETAVGLGAASNVVGSVAGNLQALRNARGNPRGLFGAGLNLGADITQGLDSVGIGNGVLRIVSPGLRAFGGILGQGQAVAEDDYFDDAEFADQFAATSDMDEETLEQFYALSDSASTLQTGKSTSDAIPGWAIALLALGGVVLVALVVVQVQIILVLRRRLPSERTN